MRDYQTLHLVVITSFGIVPFPLAVPRLIYDPTWLWGAWLAVTGGIAWFCARHYLFPWLSWLWHRRRCRRIGHTAPRPQGPQGGVAALRP